MSPVSINNFILNKKLPFTRSGMHTPTCMSVGLGEGGIANFFGTQRLGSYN